MAAIEVKNPNIFVDIAKSALAGAKHRRSDIRESGRPLAETQLVYQLAQVRLQIEQLVCSSTWGDDCLYRGAEYAPDFRCSCPVCRELFPHRRHPRSARESKYSLDCQIESDEDPELAADFALLRNDRPRIGSVFPRMRWSANGGRR
jgi:hypothetical protein